MGNKILVGSNFNFKNRIINGGFQVWQRREGFAGNTDYSADRMYVDNQGEGIVGKGKIALDSVSLVDNIDPFGDSSGVALWKLDGDANDVGGNYNGTFSGVSFVSAKFGLGAKAESTTDSVDYGYVLDTSKDYTISLWVLTTGGGISTFLCNNRYSVAYPTLTILSNVIRICKYNSTDTGASTILYEYDFSLSENIFYNIVVVKSGLNIFSYINGFLRDNQTMSDNSGVGNYSIGSFNIDDNTNVNIGDIVDQVRIFNRALTDEEVKELFFEESKIINKPAFSHKITSIPDFSSKYIKSLEYRFEGQHLADLVEAKEKVTVSFTMNSRKAGTYAIALQNKTDSNNIETILQEFTYNGNEDEKISVTFDLSQFTTPVNYDNNLGLVLVIGGYTQDSSLVGTVGLNSGEKICTSNCVAYDNEDFVSIENLQLEKGENATEFEYRPIQIEEELCRRYYRISNNTTPDPEIISMRTTPTVTGSSAPYKLNAEL